MINKKFLESKKFAYDIDYQEWRLYSTNYYYTLWQKPTNKSLWTLSYVDNDDYIKEVITCNETDMLKYIDSIQRDIKIDSIIN